jgi:nucleoside-diphosphate-sugar epimerase
MKRILITGSSGLVGRALRRDLQLRGHDVSGLDLRADHHERGDVRDREHVSAALDGVTGVIHLAAVSRVAWGERDPEGCWTTNVDGLRTVLECARSSAASPWFVFASSREVYGQAEALPVSEDAALLPVNVYGRTKLAGEMLIEAARRDGLRAATVRLSNVYGSTADHEDRVLPAFARAAARGATLRVDGSHNEFDFTHVSDTSRGLVALVEHLEAGAEPPPPIQFVTGVSTTLADAARYAVSFGRVGAVITEAPSRAFDVGRFRGTWARAHALLGWSPRVAISEGLERLVSDFQRDCEHPRPQVGAQ